jgi:hypothetical protein
MISTTIRAGARRVSDWLLGVRQAPATLAWLATVSFTRLLLILGSQSFGNRLLGAASTNLENLSRHPVRALAASPFFVTGNRYYLVFGAMCVLFLAPLERRIGSRRWLAGACLGHVATTLLVAAGLTLVARGSDGVGTIDVGPSYAARFLIAGYACLLPMAVRRAGAAFLVSISLLQLIFGRSYTDWGHLLAVALGLACAPILLRSVPRTNDEVGARASDGHRAFPQATETSAPGLISPGAERNDLAGL